MSTFTKKQGTKCVIFVIPYLVKNEPNRKNVPLEFSIKELALAAAQKK